MKRLALAALLLVTACSVAAEPATQSANVEEKEPAAEVEPRDALDEVFAAEEATDLGGLFHPELGVFVMHRPGAIDEVLHVAGQEALAEAVPWIAEFLSVGACPLSDEMPVYECETFTDEGCFFEATEGYDRASQLMLALNEYVEEADYGEAMIDGAKEREQLVEATVLITERRLALHFGRIDGELYLLFVDASRYECGA